MTDQPTLEKVFLGNFLAMVQPRVVLELGAFHAVTTDFICSFLEANNIDGHVYAFDVPDFVARLRSENERVQALEAEGKLTMVSGFLPDTLTDLLEKISDPIDLVLVDATHDYPSVMSELERLWPRLSDHGLIICHDYDFRPEHEGVRYAVDRFTASKSDAQMISLMAKPEIQTLDDLSPYKFVSTLAVIRKRPYKSSTMKLMRHMYQEANWKTKRRTGQTLPNYVKNKVKAPFRKLRNMLRDSKSNQSSGDSSNG